MRAIARNAHVVHDMDVALAVVPLESGELPVHWPEGGMTRAQLLELNAAGVDGLLADYGLPNGPASGSLAERRRRLALHIGVPGM